VQSSLRWFTGRCYKSNPDHFYISNIRSCGYVIQGTDVWARKFRMWGKCGTLFFVIISMGLSLMNGPAFSTSCAKWIVWHFYVIMHKRSSFFELFLEYMFHSHYPSTEEYIIDLHITFQLKKWETQKIERIYIYIYTCVCMYVCLCAHVCVCAMFVHACLLVRACEWMCARYSQLKLLFPYWFQSIQLDWSVMMHGITRVIRSQIQGTKWAT
jgi:hypothetical protein